MRPHQDGGGHGLRQRSAFATACAVHREHKASAVVPWLRTAVQAGCGPPNADQDAHMFPVGGQEGCWQWGRRSVVPRRMGPKEDRGQGVTTSTVPCMPASPKCQHPPQEDGSLDHFVLPFHKAVARAGGVVRRPSALPGDPQAAEDASGSAHVRHQRVRVVRPFPRPGRLPTETLGQMRPLARVAGVCSAGGAHKTDIRSAI